MPPLFPHQRGHAPFLTCSIGKHLFYLEELVLLTEVEFRFARPDHHIPNFLHPWQSQPIEKPRIHGHGAKSDWTWGCVALENEHMKELYDAVSVGTPVTIKP